MKDNSEDDGQCQWNFVYSDADTHSKEIAELYSYAELNEFQLNYNVFQYQMNALDLPPSWRRLDPLQRKSIAYQLLDKLDVSQRDVRLQAMHCILYLAQGCWAEVRSEKDLQQCVVENIILLYEIGAFPAFVALLNLEIECMVPDLTVRVILTVLYLITETIRAQRDNPDYKDVYERLRAELNASYDDELLSVKLLGMVVRFCSGSASHFPMRKVVLLLWKVSLVTLGGFDMLRQLKYQYRNANGLPPSNDDTVENTKSIPSVEFHIPNWNQRVPHEEVKIPPYKADITTLPWEPKVRQKDIDEFLNCSRFKFFGYSLINDHDSLAGLPPPIHEGVKTLKRHLYISLADVQIKKEEEIFRNPISTSDFVEMTPSEILYEALLPNIQLYMSSLLKVLLAASPIPAEKSQSTENDIDVYRQKEVVVKAVSAILLLYLKHFKINHIYQFEYVSQHLVFANCIPLILKFFNQTISQYVSSQNQIPSMEFPSCVLGEQDSETVAPYSWRNVFSCINLLRVLNKLVKWKESRVIMLVMFESAPILQRTLKVRNATMQLYALKLLKMQTKYLGRQWRKSNMKTISAIYAMVRHRLNDDWVHGDQLARRTSEYEREEAVLRMWVDRFHSRRYPFLIGTA